MKIVLYRKSYVEPVAWGYGDDANLHAIRPYIEITFSIFYDRLPFFGVHVQNKSFSDLNIFKALLRALESETVGMAKYDRLKERCRDKGFWNKL